MKGKKTQADEVAEALRQRGGYATLKELYELVPHKTWGTQTPYATIRRILQKDPRSRFFKIKPGLWGLTECRERILSQLSIDETATPQQKEEFDHTYYQGLVVEIGSLCGFETFVPKQDRSKLFLGKPLSSLVSIEDIYPFTYPELVKTASTVDVIWFNKRRMPHAFWEIEHTTSFDTTLAKFIELQDFRSGFYIVADSMRYNQFKSKMSKAAYQSAQKWIRFISYEKLAELHAAAKVYPKMQRLLRISGGFERDETDAL